MGHLKCSSSHILQSKNKQVILITYFDLIYLKYYHLNIQSKIITEFTFFSHQVFKIRRILYSCSVC